MRRQVGGITPLAHRPHSHGVGLENTVEQDATLLHAVDRLME